MTIIIVKILYNTMCFAFIFDLIFLASKCHIYNYHPTAAKVIASLAILGLLITMGFINTAI